MLDFMWKKLAAFRSCFSRKRTFELFVIIIIGLLFRYDTLGVTSIIRCMNLKEDLYESLIHFFKSTAYNLSDLKKVWYQIIAQSEHLYHTEDGRVLLLGDGTKVPKEARRMPGVKKLHQESENVGKEAYIFGHMYGGLAAYASNDTQAFAIPLSMEIQDGLSETANWKEGEETRSESHVVRMISNAYDAAKQLGSALLVLDRYFLTVPVLKMLKSLNSTEHKLHIITRAKGNCVVYDDPKPSESKRGRPRKKGDAHKIIDFFTERAEDFKETTVFIYGSKEKVKYYCVDQLWGKTLYQKLRFVLVKSNRGNCIFVSTDLLLDPVKIIEYYSKRFKIEVLFREMKQQIHGFGYHFWSKHMPKLNRFKKKTDPDPLKNVNETDRVYILGAIRATECFVLLSCIALGITQLIALDKKYSEQIIKSRYLRTKTEGHISEASVLYYLRQNFFACLLKAPALSLTSIISATMKDENDI